MGTAWIFPGQGAEEPGMGLALASMSREARAWLDEASRVTGIDVPRALERGGRALERTDVLQPVLLAVSLASVGQRESSPPNVVAGHSLGELGAACWAASLSMAEALELAASRGSAMAAAAALRPGGMVAVRGTLDAKLEALIDRGRARGELTIAARNAEDETVVSGEPDALAWLQAELPGRCTALRVGGAWHSELMRPVVEPLRARLRVAFAGRSLRAPVVSAARVGAPTVEELPDALAEGIVGPVLFWDCVRHLERLGIDHAVLPEPSRTTRSLLRRASSRRWSITAPWLRAAR